MVTTEKRDPVGAVIRTTRLLARMNRGRRADVIYFELMAEYFERIRNARVRGDFVVEHALFFPAELLYAMDLVPMHIEETSWMIALFGGQISDILAAAAERGYAGEICSGHRMTSGGLHLNALPKPDAVVWSNLVCDSSFKTGNHIREHFHIPGFFVDFPYQRSPEEEQYLLTEFEDVIASLEKHSGRKFNEDRLGEVMDRVSRQIDLIRAIDDLRKAVPSPLPPQDFLKLMTVDCLFAGLPRATEYLEALRDEVAGAVRQGKGVLDPDKERFRIVSITMPPLRLMAMIDRTSREHGAVGVADPLLCDYGRVPLDAHRPLERLVQKIRILPPLCMWGPLDGRAARLVVDSAVSHRCNGAILYSQLGCGQVGATIRVLKEALAEVDIPMLVINADTVDVNAGVEEEVRQEIERFYEFLGDR